MSQKNMSQNINLRDGEIAVVIGNASIIMNVNTAFEAVAKLFSIDCDCTKQEKPDIDINKNDNKPKVACPEDPAELTKEPETVSFYPFTNVPYVKTDTIGGKDKVPVLACSFDPERAARFNDLRAGVGKCIKLFDSMSAADLHYGVAAGTASAVSNTWLPYLYHIGAMNPMIGDRKNYRFSSKYDGKPLRWSFRPYYPADDVKRVVVFRADAVPLFILDRYTKKQS